MQPKKPLMTDPIMALPLFAEARRKHRRCPEPAAKVPGSISATELPIEVLQIINLLMHRYGREAGMTATAIARHLGINPDSSDSARNSYVRSLIGRHLVDWPYLLAACPSAGYFRPATVDEIAAYSDDLDGRAKSILARRKTFRLLAQRDGYIYANGSWSRQS